MQFSNPTDGGSWGFVHANGSWDGMVRMVSVGEVDIMMSSGALRYLTSQSMFGTHAYDEDFITIASNSVVPLPNYWVVLKPFTLKVWLLLIASVPVTALVAFLLSKAELVSAIVRLFS